MNMDEFDNDKSIEPGMLDVEAARQAETFFKWAERRVASSAQVDRAKFDLENIAAKLAMDIRAHPSKFDLEKVTESAIESRVKIDPKYVKAYEDLLAARQEDAILSVAVEAMQQKKRMIEILVTLHGQEYFAGPSVPRDLVAAWSEYKESRSDKAVERGKQVARKRVRRSDD